MVLRPLLLPAIEAADAILLRLQEAPSISVEIPIILASARANITEWIIGIVLTQVSLDEDEDDLFQPFESRRTFRLNSTHFQAIRNRRKNFARALHPDKLPVGLSADLRQICTERFRDMNTMASEVLDRGVNSMILGKTQWDLERAERELWKVYGICTIPPTRFAWILRWLEVEWKNVLKVAITIIILFWVFYGCYRGIAKAKARLLARKRQHLPGKKGQDGLRQGWKQLLGNAALYAAFSVMCMPAVAWSARDLRSDPNTRFGSRIERDSESFESDGVRWWIFSGPLIFLSPFAPSTTAMLEGLKIAYYLFGFDYGNCTLDPCNRSGQGYPVGIYRRLKAECCVLWMEERIADIIVAYGFLTAHCTLNRWLGRFVPCRGLGLVLWLAAVSGISWLSCYHWNWEAEFNAEYMLMS